MENFHSWSPKELSSPNGCVYIHCVNGKDRSAFAVFCFLRSYCNFPVSEAYRSLQTRIDAQGHCMATLKEIPQNLWDKLDLLLQGRQ